MEPSETQVSSYLPYHEPGIITILTQAALLLVLNIFNSLFDSLIYCGLLAQVFIGIAWGTPGGKLLNQDVENVIVQLGYLGLLLLVYEGGLSINITTLKSNLILSILVATTGILLPIALSFTLGSLLGATPLQCFAAGAALCATSLGTTFTVLNTSGLVKTRLGVVLASAAMMDDVVGLVMVQVISNLGSSSSSSFSWKTVVRPLGVSFAFAMVVPLACWGMVRPISEMIMRSKRGAFKQMLESEHTPFVIHTVALLGSITAATYAGTSNLFAAYLAGAAVSWWDSEVNISGSQSSQAGGVVLHPEAPREVSPSAPTAPQSKIQIQRKVSTGTEVFDRYYATALHRILKPFFFVSSPLLY